MTVTKLDQMFDLLKAKPRRRLVAAFANDSHTIEAAGTAVEMGIVSATLVGDIETMRRICKEEGIEPDQFRMVHEPSEERAAALAVKLVRSGEGDILMKGLISTDQYMRAILHKEEGLMDPGAVLTHVSVIENPGHHKLLICGDVAIIPAPDLKQKTTILRYLIKTAHKLNIPQPKVALIAATEQMLPGMQACVDAAILSKMADRGQFKGALIDGPLALDVAIDPESAAIKKLQSQVAGEADCLLFPTIEAGNVFYKTCTKLVGAELGAIVCGARVPAVLSSRGDSTRTKMYSIALAALLAE